MRRKKIISVSIDATNLGWLDALAAQVGRSRSDTLDSVLFEWRRMQEQAQADLDALMLHQAAQKAVSDTLAPFKGRTFRAKFNKRPDEMSSDLHAAGGTKAGKQNRRGDRLPAVADGGGGGVEGLAADLAPPPASDGVP